MYIRNNTLAVIFRVIFIIVCGAGIVMKLMSIGFAFNTVLSDFALVVNTLALVYFAYLIIARPGYERGALRGAVNEIIAKPTKKMTDNFFLFMLPPVSVVFCKILN